MIGQEAIGSGGAAGVDARAIGRLAGVRVTQVELTKWACNPLRIGIDDSVTCKDVAAKVIERAASGAPLDAQESVINTAERECGL